MCMILSNAYGIGTCLSIFFLGGGGGWWGWVSFQSYNGGPLVIRLFSYFILNGHSNETKFLMTNGSLMKVKSIAECSPLEHSAMLLTCIKR